MAFMGKKVRLDERKWHAQFYNLKEFKKNFGHCDVPQLNMDGSHNKLGAGAQTRGKLKSIKCVSMTKSIFGYLMVSAFAGVLLTECLKKILNRLNTIKMSMGTAGYRVPIGNFLSGAQNLGRRKVKAS